eukprot:Lithocolla_globosa_v1_NODE_2011_length_2208_cov_6.254529.p3 type:complete len:113 gc:universal NODE_2011_length_2208_cov_6.254529:1725-2063(+)
MSLAFSSPFSIAPKCLSVYRNLPCKPFSFATLSALTKLSTNASRDAFINCRESRNRIRSTLKLRYFSWLLGMHLIFPDQRPSSLMIRWESYPRRLWKNVGRNLGTLASILHF